MWTRKEAEKEFGELEEWQRYPDQMMSWYEPIGGDVVELFSFDGGKVLYKLYEGIDELNKEQRKIFKEEDNHDWNIYCRMKQINPIVDEKKKKGDVPKQILEEARELLELSRGCGQIEYVATSEKLGIDYFVLAYSEEVTVGFPIFFTIDSKGKCNTINSIEDRDLLSVFCQD